MGTYLCVYRGYWFSGATDVKIVREKIDKMCPAGEKSAIRKAFSHVLEPFTWTPSGEPYAVDAYAQEGDSMGDHKTEKHSSPPVSLSATRNASTRSDTGHAGRPGGVNGHGGLSKRSAAKPFKHSGLGGGGGGGDDGGEKHLKPQSSRRYLKSARKEVVVPAASQTFKMVVYQVCSSTVSSILYSVEHKPLCSLCV